MPEFQVVALDTQAAKPCPCGLARRAFADLPGSVASLHIVEIKQDSQSHYHKKTTELYLVLEGEGHIEADGLLFPVKPMTAIYIPPGCRHRAIGRLKIVNIPVPAFDATDEYLE